MGKVCKGCGVTLQYTDSKKQGYLPKKDGEYCQRCFKISNYGSYLPVQMTKEDYKKEVNKVAKESDVALAVFDIIDFEGSFSDEILDILREMDSIIIVNKVDIVPNSKHPSEISDWVKDRLAEEGIVPLDIAIVSAKSKYGANGIERKLRHFYPRGGQAVVLGATNVGKSSIVNHLIGEKSVTTSKYPGTTLKSIKNKIGNTNITLVDTPGLIPEGRLSDLVCHECNLKIVPSGEITRRTYKMKPGRYLTFGSLLWFKVLNGKGNDDTATTPIFTAFASKEVKFHETNFDRLHEIMEDNKDFLKLPCEKCRDEYHKEKFVTKKYTVNEGEELVFTGLGWISVKRGPLELELSVPKDVCVVVRDAFITPNRNAKR